MMSLFSTTVKLFVEVEIPSSSAEAFACASDALDPQISEVGTRSLETIP